MLATSSVKLGSSMLGKTTFKRSNVSFLHFPRSYPSLMFSSIGLGSYGLLTFMLCLMVSWSFRDRVDFSEYGLSDSWLLRMGWDVD